jgi:adenine/guanine phosphoribosyltransferase-like PRPP-binding protein
LLVLADPFDSVLGIEARGFIFAPALAYAETVVAFDATVKSLR